MSKLNIVLIIMTILLVGCTSILYNKYKGVESKYQTSMENIKAYSAELSGLKDNNRVFKLTIDLLKYYNDSILLKMDSVRKLLKIKDSKIQSMSYLLTQSSKTDTLVFRDTLFVNNLNIDTVIGDKWYNLELKLKYPSLIIVSPSFVSEKYINTYDKKETVNPPKKFFLFRWFQKKHTVRVVDVYEESPYSKVKKERFVEIVK